MDPKNQSIENKTWYNKPLWGEKTLLEKFTSFGKKTKVPDDIVFLHNRSFDQLKEIASIAYGIDNQKFTNKEFLYFIKVKLAIAKNFGDYEGLRESIELLMVAIAAKENFAKIEQIEFRYRGSKQQEFYRHVDRLIFSDIEKKEFRNQIAAKLNEVFPELMTEEGRTALQAYNQAINNISDYELGLKLMRLFKQYELTNFSILSTISDIVYSFLAKDLQNLTQFNLKVKMQYELFDKLGQIIGLTESQRTPDTFARMVQYAALSGKHELSYLQFNELVLKLQQWQKLYREVTAWRETYNSQEYKQPKDFTREILGLDLYQKYQEYLP